MEGKWSVRVVLLVASACLMGPASAQDANCDYSQTVQVGQTHYVYSPRYPNLYSPGTTCRWVATCPANYNLRLTCPEIAMPFSTNCQLDRLLVSKSGDLGLVGADTYCGTGTLTATSINQRLSVGLLSSSTSTGGRFSCTLTAVPAQPVNPTCNCGWKFTNRIVNGTQTGVNEFPAMAALVDKRISSIKCGAVILSRFYLLTAAHCLVGHTLATLQVVAGEHNINAASTARQVLQISRLYGHPQYNPNNYDNDVGVVTTATAITFTERVGPICLPFKYSGATFAGSVVTALGWGTAFPSGPTSDYLKKVELDVLSQATCQSAISSLTPRQLCTFRLGNDACQDDSGGPMLYQEPGTGVLFSVAIISSGVFCASRLPAVNTRVTSQLDWIIANTPGANYCVKP